MVNQLEAMTACFSTARVSFSMRKGTSSPRDVPSKKISSTSTQRNLRAIFTSSSRAKKPACTARWCWHASYIQKCGFRKAIIDSAADRFGADGGHRRRRGGGGECDRRRDAGTYSSPGSIDDARALASNLGIRFELLSINCAVEAYRKTLKEVFANQKEDVTEENIQSRARGTLLMALSNKFGAIVLSTGNKSELGVATVHFTGHGGGLASSPTCRKLWYTG